MFWVLDLYRLYSSDIPSKKSEEKYDFFLEKGLSFDVIRHEIAKFDPLLFIFWGLGLLHLDLYSNILDSFLKILHAEVVDNFSSTESVWVDRIELSIL
jgi:hypothetical protein